MANFSLKNFQAEVRSRGLSKPNRFEIMFPPPLAMINKIVDIKPVLLYCESTSLPPQNIGVKTQRIYGPGYPRPVSTDYGGDGITMTFLLDQPMDIRAFFDLWLSSIVDPNQFFVNYQSNYVVPITINQLNMQDQVVYSAILEDAFPRSVSLLELNQSTQNSVHKLSVTFVYRRWRPVHRLTDTMQSNMSLSRNNPLLLKPDEETYQGATVNLVRNDWQEMEDANPQAWGYLFNPVSRDTTRN
jgi:hypothetical protein